MEKKGGVYEVPCKVNGLALKFIFDTGASNVSISLAEAIFMIKNGYLDMRDLGEDVYYSIANGNVAKGTKLTIREIEIAGLKLYNIEASIVHETNAPLLLGQSVIEKLGAIQLNGNELIIMSHGNKGYDYSNYDYSNNSRTDSYSNKSKKNSSIQPFYQRTYKGIQEVYSFSDILERPDKKSKIIGLVENNKVEVLEKINSEFYKVKSENKIGYLWAGWFKN